MRCDINWDREDYWNELYKCDEYFLSFNFDHCAFEEDKWRELVEKWKLNTKITIAIVDTIQKAKIQQHIMKIILL